MSASNPPTEVARERLLDDPTRRLICSILTAPDPPLSERDLAVELATRCLDKPAAEITTEDRHRYLIRLHHHHLPKLAAYGLVDYSRSSHIVSITTAGCDALAATETSLPTAASTVLNEA